ncbi:hypothetical protein V8E54_012342 [Elaphomyces granulatus]
MGSSLKTWKTRQNVSRDGIWTPCHHRMGRRTRGTILQRATEQRWSGSSGKSVRMHTSSYAISINQRSSKSVAASAALAITEAVNSGCDIISMSWTIYETPVNRGDLVEFDKAVSLAASKGIICILYCAGQDQGQYEENLGKPYPASSTTNVLKRIGSASAFGNRTDNVNLNNVDYLFPSAAAYKGGGLAALILWCAEASANGVQDMKTGNAVERFNFRQMNSLFDKLKTEKHSASLVDVTGILNNVTNGGKDYARKLIERCKKMVTE